MEFKQYQDYWLVFVNLKAKEGLFFNDLIDTSKTNISEIFDGAWANIIVRSKKINFALEIVPMGLDELGFEVVFIDKIENIASLIEYGEINEDLISELEWLDKTDFVFKISDRLFPY